MAMQPAAQAANSALSSKSSKPSGIVEPERNQAMTPLPLSATDELWMRMASRYGHAWVSQYGPMPDGIAAAEWRDTLWGITSTQMRAGFDEDAIRGAEWPPSSTKFRAMCLGIPPLAEVRSEINHMLRYSAAGQGSLMSRFARGVWSRIDSYAYRNASGRIAERIMREAFDLTRDFVMNGGTLPVEPSGLVKHEKPESRPASAETAKSHLDKIAEMLKTEPSKPHSEVD
jgi:hypothetical protein